MASTDVLSAVRVALDTIAVSLDSVEFVVPRPGRVANEAARNAVVDTVRKYLLPRLREPDAPVVAVLVGLSGVGKSTILNSLAQEPVSAPGVVRPTTMSGVLWAHRDHAARYWTEFVSRVRDQIGPTTDVVIGEDPLTTYLTFVDTPPLEMAPRDAASTAAETLMFADLCIFVTSVERYADAAPLGFLETARARGIPILFVLNRLPGDADQRRELLGDFADKLVSAGLVPEPDPAFIFGVEEATDVRWHGGLAPESVAALRRELSEVSDPEFRLVVIDETAEATVQAVADQAEAVLTELRVEAAERRRLDEEARNTYQRFSDAMVSRLESGKFAPLAGNEVWSLASVDLAGLVTRAAGLAADETVRLWMDQPWGTRLFDPGHEGLRRHGPESASVAKGHLDDWIATLHPFAAATRRLRPGKRRLRRLVRDLWKVVLDPDYATRRWKGDRLVAVAEARTLLGEAMSRAVIADGERFTLRLTAHIDPELPDRIQAATTYLRAIPDSDAADEATPESTTRGS